MTLTCLDALRTAFVTLIDAIRTAAYAAGANGPADPPLLLLFDELANIATIPGLDKLASTASGQGIQIVSIVQDLAQLHARYGKAAETIINNHKGKLILPGSADTSTLDWTSRITGDQELRQTSTTARTGIRDSTTESTTWRPLAPPHVVRQLQPGHGLLVYGHLPTAVVRLCART